MYSAQDLPAECLASLVEASTAINSAQGVDQTLGAIARAAASVLAAEASSVIMLDKARNKQVFRAATGDHAEQLINVEYDAEAGISGAALRSGQVAVVHDAQQETLHHKEIDRLVGFRTRGIIAAPLIHRGEKLGVVEVLNRRDGGEFREQDCQLARVFANLAAIAVVNSQDRDRLRRHNRGLKQSMRQQDTIIGISAAIREVKSSVRQVAASSATVLLLGETGTGKELAARLVHAQSKRADRPFVAVNCAALTRTLLESELFGHEAGAFTGATARKLGRFELADGGTIFLDEVAEVDGEIQVKLLRVLQEKEIVRVGGVSPIGCDVRVIAATNRGLDTEMKAGRFREDLYYRLNVFPIRMPPLRDRKEDIPLLAEHFLGRLAQEMNIPTPAICQSTIAALWAYDFPGNIRELQNILERACLMFNSKQDASVRSHCIGLTHLPPELTGLVAPAAGSALEASEKAMVLNALRANKWNQTRAAAALGVTRDSIRYRMKKYGIRRPR